MMFARLLGMIAMIPKYPPLGPIQLIFFLLIAIYRGVIFKKWVANGNYVNDQKAQARFLYRRSTCTDLMEVT